MHRRAFLSGMSLALGSLAVTGAAEAQRGPGGWELLGTKNVGFLVDRDVVSVGKHEGRFKAIKLRVSGNEIYVMDLKVVYANGAPDDIPVRSQIRAGGETRSLDLRGHERAIKEIQMVYRSKPSFKGQATIEVWGQT